MKSFLHEDKNLHIPDCAGTDLPSSWSLSDNRFTIYIKTQGGAKVDLQFCYMENNMITNNNNNRRINSVFCMITTVNLPLPRPVCILVQMKILSLVEKWEQHNKASLKDRGSLKNSRSNS